MGEGKFIYSRCRSMASAWGQLNTSDNAFQEHKDYVALLKACTEKKDIQKGTSVHDDLLKKGLIGKSLFIASTLVTMYVKCGALAKAREVLDGLPARDVVTWSALIAGYAREEGYIEEALNCYGRMQCEGHSPNAVTFASILKACSSIGELDKGKQIHAEVARQGLLGDVVLGSALVDMYAKCGALVTAQEVLDGLPVRDVVTWSALLVGFAREEGHGEEALDCFDQMQYEGHLADATTFACALKASGSVQALDKGKRIHVEIAKRGLLSGDVVLGSALVDMYAKCGAFVNAHEVLDDLSVQSTVSWNALIAGYVQEGGHAEEAWNCYEQMQLEGHLPDAVTFACILKTCDGIHAVVKGEQIQGEVVRQGLLTESVMLGSSLVDMCAKCGVLMRALEVFDSLPCRAVGTWNALIAGYACTEGQCEEALNCFERMQHEGHFPDVVTFINVLKACGNIGALDTVREIHADVARQGLTRENIVLGNVLVDVYAKCSALENAQGVLESLPARDTVTWNAIITGYAQDGYGEEALDSFARMQREGHSLNVVTLMCILKACGNIGELNKGKKIHADLSSKGLLRDSILLGNAVVHMYVKCGVLESARQVLEGLPIRDIVTWNALIAGYVQEEGRGEEALTCLVRMQREGHIPDVVTFVCILKACGSTGALYEGKQIHTEAARQGLLRENIVLGNALLDMYAKCGALVNAQDVLEGLPVRNAISWNALIAGYAHYGHSREALVSFEQMQHDGISPDTVTFSCVLYSCSNSSLLDQAKTYFANMSTLYNIKPSLEHYACMINLFGRAGHIDEAVEVSKNMPSLENCVVWATLLGSCRKWINVKVGRWAFNHAL